MDISSVPGAGTYFCSIYPYTCCQEGIRILVTNGLCGPAASMTWEVGKMQNVTLHLRPAELESVCSTSPHVLGGHFDVEEHCLKWDLRLGTGVSEQLGKVSFHQTKVKVCLEREHWIQMCMTSPRAILCCEICEIMWNVDERTPIT